MGSRVIGERLHDATESGNLCMRGNFKRENREILLASVEQSGMSLRGGTVRKRH
jgi:hypothetical protein